MQSSSHINHQLSLSRVRHEWWLTNQKASQWKCIRDPQVCTANSSIILSVPVCKHAMVGVPRGKFQWLHPCVISNIAEEFFFKFQQDDTILWCLKSNTTVSVWCTCSCHCCHYHAPCTCDPYCTCSTVEINSHKTVKQYCIATSDFSRNLLESRGNRKHPHRFAYPSRFLAEVFWVLNNSQT